MNFAGDVLAGWLWPRGSWFRRGRRFDGAYCGVSDCGGRARPGRHRPVVQMTRRGRRSSTSRRMAWSGQALGRWSITLVFHSTIHGRMSARGTFDATPAIAASNLACTGVRSDAPRRHHQRQPSAAAGRPGRGHEHRGSAPPSRPPPATCSTNSAVRSVPPAAAPAVRRSGASNLGE